MSYTTGYDSLMFGTRSEFRVTIIGPVRENKSTFIKGRVGLWFQYNKCWCKVI